MSAPTHTHTQERELSFPRVINPNSIDDLDDLDLACLYLAGQSAFLFYPVSFFTSHLIPSLPFLPSLPRGNTIILLGHSVAFLQGPGHFVTYLYIICQSGS